MEGGHTFGSSYVLSYCLNTKMNHFIIFMTIPAASILHRFPELLNHSLHLKGVSWELITMRMHPFYKLPWLSSVALLRGQRAHCLAHLLLGAGAFCGYSPSVT